MTTELSSLLQEQLALLAAKRGMFKKNKKYINTLVVGSSHGDFGFNPSYFPNSFNVCCRSQDIKHSYHLYKKLSEETVNLKNIVVFYSIFSSGSHLEKSPSEKEISLALNEIFNLGISYEDDFLRNIHKKIKGKFQQLKMDLPGCNGFLPEHGKGFFPEEYLAIRRAVDHLKANMRTTSNEDFEKILELASQKNHNVFIVLPPARSDYKLAAGESEYLFRHLYKVLESYSGNNYKIINFYDDGAFKDEDFGDFDHLLPLSAGTKYLSKKVGEIVTEVS